MYRLIFVLFGGQERAIANVGLILKIHNSTFHPIQPPDRMIRHNVTPHFFNAWVFVYVAQIYWAYQFLCFFKVRITLSVDTPKTLAVSHMPLALAAMAIIFSLMLGLAPSYRYSNLSSLYHVCQPFRHTTTVLTARADFMTFVPWIPCDRHFLYHPS